MKHLKIMEPAGHDGYSIPMIPALRNILTLRPAELQRLTVCMFYVNMEPEDNL